MTEVFPSVSLVMDADAAIALWTSGDRAAARRLTCDLLRASGSRSCRRETRLERCRSCVVASSISWHTSVVPGTPIGVAKPIPTLFVDEVPLEKSCVAVVPQVVKPVCPAFISPAGPPAWPVPPSADTAWRSNW